jgi:hypothetical protein
MKKSIARIALLALVLLSVGLASTAAPPPCVDVLERSFV